MWNVGGFVKQYKTLLLRLGNRFDASQLSPLQLPRVAALGRVPSDPNWNSNNQIAVTRPRTVARAQTRLNRPVARRLTAGRGGTAITHSTRRPTSAASGT